MEQGNLFQITNHTDLANNRILHSEFVEIREMTDSESRDGGSSLSIIYQFANSIFGEVLIASTLKGVCFIAFVDDKEIAFKQLMNRYPNANYAEKELDSHQNALAIFTNNFKTDNVVKLHLSGTLFQLKVWQALLKIPEGRLSTYGKLANEIDKPKASRAVGTAIGSNPIAFLIPCHRIVQASGKIGGYMWGVERKKAIIKWEAEKRHH